MFVVKIFLLLFVCYDFILSGESIVLRPLLNQEAAVCDGNRNGHITGFLCEEGERKNKTPQCYSGILFELDASEYICCILSWDFI